jgi:nitrogen fixation/metabolism regulation signal transduction histidine kinase
MSLRVRIALLMILLTALPALLAAVLTRQLIQGSLDLGLSEEVDTALQAGVDEARAHLRAQRRSVARDAAHWAACWLGARSDGDVVPAMRRCFAAQHGESADQVVVLDPRGQESIVQMGREIEEASRPLEEGQPPRLLLHREPLEEGWSLEIRRPADVTWWNNAVRIAESLQMVRGLRVQQSDLERSFWLPFLLVYGVSTLIAVLLALRVGQGITSPVQRLVAATDEVAQGNWDIQVQPAGPSEVAQLSRSFNGMVRTLDAQGRRLVDLEKMAGWREMAQALAHEIKNPLTPIQLTVEEMRERYVGDDESYRELLKDCSRIVVEEVESLRSVVNRFREFSRPVELALKPVDLNPLVHDVGALQRDLQVELDLDPSIGRVDVDRDRIRQMLMNLATNARAATESVDEARLRFSTALRDDASSGLPATQNEWVEIVVEDNGPGIPDTERERVFEPYRTGSTGGLGLGLALVKGIVLAHGGSITVDEGTWGGARFRVTLPRSGTGGRLAAAGVDTSQEAS